MKTIGVIGGIGPQATMDFEARVHAVSQTLIPQRSNSGYPPMVVYYHRALPFISDPNGKPIPPLRPDPNLTAKLRPLGEMADFLVLTSNATHLFQDMIEETTGLKLISMIDVTVAEVQRRGWNHVGLLGFGEPRVYINKIEPLGIRYTILPADPGGLRDQLDTAINILMAGQSNQHHTNIALEAVAAIRASNPDGIILGCTEIPLLLGPANTTDPDLLNPLQLLAETAVRLAIS